MIMQRKFLLLALLLMLISVGLIAAQSSPNYVVHRTVMQSGGASVSLNYAVTSVIGQPSTDVVASSNYSVSAGFLHPLGLNYRIWLPMVTR